MEWFGSRELMPLVAWSRIVLPKLLGGLSIRNLLHHHIALLLKWIWRYFSGSQSLWKNLIQSKDNYSSSLVITELQILSKGGPWRNICKVILPHSTPKNSVHCQVRKKISNGDSTKFLHEIWVGLGPLHWKFSFQECSLLLPPQTLPLHAWILGWSFVAMDHQLGMCL